MSTSSEEDSDEDFVEESSGVRVFLRLRPMNKLETSRRSKNCIELHESPRSLTVDSPLEGEYDFAFNRVFDQDASQTEVFEHAVSPVASQLLEGYNCTVIAYGQTGTGKTRTMMGLDEGALLRLARKGQNTSEASPEKEEGAGDEGESVHSNESEVSLDDTREHDKPEVAPQGEGMILRTISAIFSLMKQSSPTIEYTIRCSYIEIYLEKILDLLTPGGVGGAALKIVDDAPADEAAGVGEENNIGGVRIVGASELCCIDESQVISLLARGNACRTVSSTKMNTDSSRSHAIFVMKIEQHDTESGETKTSVLHMADLAGSEMASAVTSSPTRAQRPVLGTGAAQEEAKMINKSLSALTKVVRAQVKSQKGAEVSVKAASHRSKLARLLRPCFGGNCMTTVILTASPSSYNIGETISAIRFGQYCRHVRNPVVVNSDYSRETYRTRLAQCEEKKSELWMLVKELAAECQRLETDSTTGPVKEDRDRRLLWEGIEQVLKERDGSETDFSIVVRKNSTVTDSKDADDVGAQLENAQMEIETLRKELKSVTDARDTAENSLAELESEIAVLRTQNGNFSADSKKTVQELIDAKNEIQVLSQRKIEVEHNLRTSQFRENEASVFLRQFRRFYRRLLRNKATQGSGSTQEITAMTAGVPDLKDLIDVDMLLLESGLIEEDELHDDKAVGTYRPSGSALLRSTAAAKKAAKIAEVLEKEQSAGGFGGSVVSNEANEDGSSCATSSSVNSSLPRIGTLDVKGGTESQDIISELGDDGVSQCAIVTETEEAENDSDVYDLNGTGQRKKVEAHGISAEPSNSTGDAGADAGAGASTDQPESSDNTYANSNRGSEAFQMETMTVNYQKMLSTPAGRLTIMKDKELGQDLLRMTERCIELQIALNEQKATVDMLTDRSGSLNEKRLAQETIQLRQELERKKHDLQAIIWKMNELHLINKTYNDKMASREQHVAYLEENLIDLQNANRKLVLERQEEERKLRGELEDLRVLVDSMTIPVWHFGNQRIQERTLASRIILPVVGGERSTELNLDVPKRRLSEGASEQSLGETDQIDDDEEVGVLTVAAKPQDTVGAVLAAEVPGQQVELADAETQTEEVLSVMKHEIGIQTEVEVDDIGVQTEVDNDDIGIQTDDQPMIETATAGTQTVEAEMPPWSPSAMEIAAPIAVETAEWDRQDKSWAEGKFDQGDDSDYSNRGRNIAIGAGIAAGTAAVTAGVMAAVQGKDNESDHIDHDMGVESSITDGPANSAVQSSNAMPSAHEAVAAKSAAPSKPPDQSANDSMTEFWRAARSIGHKNEDFWRTEDEDAVVVSSEKEGSAWGETAPEFEDHVASGMMSTETGPAAALEGDTGGSLSSQLSSDFEGDAVAPSNGKSAMAAAALTAGGAAATAVPRDGEHARIDDSRHAVKDRSMMPNGDEESESMPRASYQNQEQPERSTKEQSIEHVNDFGKENEAANIAFPAFEAGDFDNQEPAAATLATPGRQDEWTKISQKDSPFSEALTDAREELLLGGKPADYVPRRFVKKLGPTIKPGIMKDNRKKSSGDDSKSKSSKRSSKSKKSSTSRDSKKKKKKKSSRSSHRGSDSAKEARESRSRRSRRISA